MTLYFCSKTGLKAEFVDAIDGKLLSGKDINKFYSTTKSIKQIGRELAVSEIGCALSHKKIYQKIADEKIDSALILEDDIDFQGDLVDALSILNKLPSNWELVLLGHHTGKSRSIDTQASLWGRRNFIWPQK